MAGPKNGDKLKEYLKELEILKEKKRVLEESEQRHLSPKRKPKKAKAAKKPAPRKTKAAPKAKAKPKPKVKPKPKAKAKPRPVPKKTTPKKPKAVKVPLPRKLKKPPVPKPEIPEKTPEEKAEEEEFSKEDIQNFQIGGMNMEQLINKVCDILVKNQTEGVAQAEVWRKLKLTVRDGFRLALKLEWLGIISREKVLEKGRWTYKLILKRTPISTRSIVDSPCLTCPVEQKCTPDGEVSPYTCELIKDWVIVEAKRLRKR